MVGSGFRRKDVQLFQLAVDMFVDEIGFRQFRVREISSHLTWHKHSYRLDVTSVGNHHNGVARMPGFDDTLTGHRCNKIIVDAEIAIVRYIRFRTIGKSRMNTKSLFLTWVNEAVPRNVRFQILHRSATELPLRAACYPLVDELVLPGILCKPLATPV